ncbi:MAG: AAA family ATPase [Nitrospira sp.]|nr:AAA family ATPase [Nitrospira sp.]
MRLIDYLQKLAALRSNIVRDVGSYQNILWLHEIPHEKGCETLAWGTNEDVGTDIWLEVQKTNEPGLPQVPESIKQWVKSETLKNTDDFPELHSTITVQGEMKASEENPPPICYEERKLEDYPDIQQKWHRYLDEQWVPWADLHHRWEAVQRVYTKLFVIHQDQQRLGEEYELILGLGLLTWKTPTGHTVCRHLITARAYLEFESKLGRFTVGPDPDGAKLCAELDMLDATEQPFQAQKLSNEGLKSADEDPWNRSSVDSVLHSLAKVLGALGEYHPDSLEVHQARAENKPVVEFAPALILRKRSLRGLQEILNKMQIQISAGGEIPAEFLDLAEGTISGGRNESPLSKTNEFDKMEVDSTIYFPKLSNEEQRRIIQTLRSTSGVLVQGPPGTGKSHTIANLICHLLATGQRVLVTAQTPRALEVLQNHLPEEIRPLCISLLGSGNKEQRALAASVNGILIRDTQWDETSSISQIAELEKNLYQSREEKAQTDFRLRTIREAETLSQVILNGAYQGTAAKIALQLNKESTEYGWFTDPIMYEQEFPVSLPELRQLREALIQLPPELEVELELSRPDLDRDLPPKERFKELVQKQKEISTLLDRNHELLNSQNFRKVEQAKAHHVRNIIENLESLLIEIKGIKSRPMPWITSAVKEVLSDNDRPWKELLRVSKENLIGLKNRVSTVDRQEVNAPDNLDRRKLLNDAIAMKSYFDLGGKIRWPWWSNKAIVKKNQHLIEQVSIDGQCCESSEVLGKLIEYLTVEQAVEYMWNMWQGKAQKKLGSFLLQVAELEELEEALTRVVSLFDLMEKSKASIRYVQGMEEPVWHDLGAVQEFLEVCRLFIAKRDQENIQQELDLYDSRMQALTRRKNCHPLTQQALIYLETRDVDLYESVIFEISELTHKAEELNWAKAFLGKLAQSAPLFAEELKATPQNPVWENRISSFYGAWNWAKAHSWLREFLNSEKVPTLERRAKQLDEEERGILKNLAEINAWKFCFSRLRVDHRRHLIGWQQAIARIGKGTGKHAPKHRRDAQQQLNKCKEAVPAWVIPLHRLWDTVDPSPGMFDVIIVDEASQCGPDALPLMYLGKKLLIVGDDQQISPEAVGINEDAVYRLRQEHLAGFEHADSFGLNSSLFDHAKRRFGNRIVLREHFRCMPEIIRFSNDLCYHDTPLIPLRQYPPERLEPLKVIHVSGGNREGEGGKAINRPEADALVRQVVQCCRDDRYIGKTMGVIVLQGEAQAHLIESKLLKELEAEEIEERKLNCGNPYHFQGGERDIIFLSMVAAPNQRIGAFTKATDQRRFNVAASRAKDQMWLFHSATRNDLSDTCLRKRLLEFFLNPSSQISQALGDEAEQLRERAYSANRQIEKSPKPFDSWFELDVCLTIATRGYRVIPQYPIAGKFIDLVIEGKESQLAVECFGDHWHGSDQYQADMERQRKLERSGWQFFIVRECLFNANPEAALEDLWNHLRQLKIFPVGFTLAVQEESQVNQEETSKKLPLENVKSVDSGIETNIEITSKNKKLEEGNKNLKHENSNALNPIPNQIFTDQVEISYPSLKTIERGIEEFAFDGYQAPYVQWHQETLKDPRLATLEEITRGLISIISVEGPMVCHRAYWIYARAVDPPIRRVGGQIRATFNEAISKALRQGLIEGRDEHGNRELYCRIVRKAGTPPVVVRKRRGRNFDEIPPSELGAVMKYLYRQDVTQGTEQLLQSVLERYDFGRMTSNIRESLLKIKAHYLD